MTLKEDIGFLTPQEHRIFVVLASATPSTFPFAIKRARVEAGLTQKLAAELVGVDVGTFNRWENGRMVGVRTEQMTEWCAQMIERANAFENLGFAKANGDHILGTSCKECRQAEARHFTDSE